MTINKLNVVAKFLEIRPSLMRYISKIVPPAEVEDIVQETYVRLCQLKNYSLDNNRPKQHNKSFLYTIAKNLALDHNKKSEVRLADSVENEDGFGEQSIHSPYEYSVTNERFRHFCEVVRILPQQCRKVFVLKKVYGFTQQEIATELNISLKTVDSHVVNAMKRLKLHMDKDKKHNIQHKHQHNNDIGGYQNDN
ncbi:RNA polymerase sigma factor [Colwelliaceae bacterium 6441]